MATGPSNINSKTYLSIEKVRLLLHVSFSYRYLR